MVIEGKYCQIRVRLSDLGELRSANLSVLENFKNSGNIIEDLNIYDRVQEGHLEALDERESKETLR